MFKFVLYTSIHDRYLICLVGVTVSGEKAATASLFFQFLLGFLPGHLLVIGGLFYEVFQLPKWDRHVLDAARSISRGVTLHIILMEPGQIIYSHLYIMLLALICSSFIQSLVYIMLPVFVGPHNLEVYSSPEFALCTQPSCPPACAHLGRYVVGGSYSIFIHNYKLSMPYLVYHTANYCLVRIGTKRTHTRNLITDIVEPK